MWDRLWQPFLFLRGWEATPSLPFLDRPLPSWGRALGSAPGPCAAAGCTVAAIQASLVELSPRWEGRQAALPVPQGEGSGLLWPPAVQVQLFVSSHCSCLLTRLCLFSLWPELLVLLTQCPVDIVWASGCPYRTWKLSPPPSVLASINPGAGR